MENKKQVIQDFLSHGKSVVVVNSTVDGVKLPQHLMDQFHIRLSLSLKFPHPILFKDTGIETKLNFADRQQDVFLPYSSIYGVSNSNDPFEHNYVWEEDAPIELLDQAEEFAIQLEQILKEEKEKSKYLDFTKEVNKLKKV